jgi:hypothetical protein
MHVEGRLAPATAEEARAAYDELAPAAKTVVRETAKAMSFDRAEYGERVTSDVVETALDALFASLLEVNVGSREEYERFRADHPDLEERLEGSESVGRVAWHPAPAAGLLVAATFHEEREAAVGTLRRQAFGKAYRDLL